MRVTAFFISFSPLGKGKEPNIQLREGSTVSDLMDLLADLYGDAFEEVYCKVERSLGARTAVFLNSRNIHYQDYLDTRLSDGDQVAIAYGLA